MLVTFSCCLAWICTFSLGRGGSVLCAVIRWAWNARSLLGLWLVVALAALDANVDGGVEISSGCADGQWALFDSSWADLWRGSAERTGLTGWLHSLSSECASWAWLAFSIDTELHSRCALIAALRSRFGFCRSRGLTQAANLTFEWALVGLEESVTAWSAQTSIRFEVLAGGATLFAVASRASSWSDGDSNASRNVRALRALSLSGLGLVCSAWAWSASLVCRLVEWSDRAWHAIWNDRDLSHGASVLWCEKQRSWVRHRVGENVFDGELIFFQNQFLKQFFHRWAFAGRRLNNWIAAGKIITRLVSRFTREEVLIETLEPKRCVIKKRKERKKIKIGRPKAKPRGKEREFIHQSHKKSLTCAKKAFFVVQIFAYVQLTVNQGHTWRLGRRSPRCKCRHSADVRCGFFRDRLLYKMHFFGIGTWVDLVFLLFV